ncbi:hypothetical protein TWF730_000064 [Orbilia blumenaviensis]|uniref:Uncharacterized protein n=1 Tax=Orbilia blumenaviensis TaxID=1796055 RepID=A0AAV9VKR6_9PEZI
MPTFIPQNKHLEENAAAIRTLTKLIKEGEIYRDVAWIRLHPSSQSELSPQNWDLTSLLRHLLNTSTFLSHYVDTPAEYPIKAEAHDMSFILSHQSFLYPPALTPENKFAQIMTAQSSATATEPQIFVSLSFTTPWLVRNVRPVGIHDHVDYDVQFTFSNSLYLGEAPSPMFEVSAVVVQRRDVEEWLRMARARSSFEDMELEIVMGPTRVFDEAGECWVVSLILI